MNARRNAQDTAAVLLILTLCLAFWGALFLCWWGDA